VIVVIVLLGTGRGPYRERKAGLDSPEAKRAFEMLSAIAAEPSRAPQFMSKQAGKRAEDAVARAGKRMHQAASLSLKDAAWFGDYLRVGVACSVEDGKPFDVWFYMVREGDDLRITGAQG